MLASLCVSWVQRGIYWADHTRSDFIGGETSKVILEERRGGVHFAFSKYLPTPSISIQVTHLSSFTSNSKIHSAKFVQSDVQRTLLSFECDMCQTPVWSFQQNSIASSRPSVSVLLLQCSVILRTFVSPWCRLGPESRQEMVAHSYFKWEFYILSPDWLPPVVCRLVPDRRWAPSYRDQPSPRLQTSLNSTSQAFSSTA